MANAVFASDADRRELLDAAIRNNNIAEVKSLILEGVSVNGLYSYLAGVQLSPLINALEYKRPHIVKLLLEHGADPELQLTECTPDLIFNYTALDLVQESEYEDQAIKDLLEENVMQRSRWEKSIRSTWVRGVVLGSQKP